MVRPFIPAVCVLSLFFIAHSGYCAEPTTDVVYRLSFSDNAGEPPLKWLAAKGFVPKRDADNQSKVVYSVANNALVMQTKRQAQGLLLNEADVLNYSKIRIEWGVDKFPEGASYEKAVRSDAIMIYVFFGDKKLSSGSLLIPDSPYFIGLSLCQSDPIGKAFTGRYFQAGGRYVCIDHPPVGQGVVSEYPIAEAFTRLFGQKEAPDISGLGISIDTESTKGSGAAKSFVKSIEFIQ